MSHFSGRKPSPTPLVRGRMTDASNDTAVPGSGTKTSRKGRIAAPGAAAWERSSSCPRYWQADQGEPIMPQFTAADAVALAVD
jgi:hypothetical protein